MYFPAKTVDFGETYQFSTVEQQFPFTNRGARAVTIEAEPLLRTATAVVRPALVAPGESGAITVRIPVGDRLGRTGFRVRVTTDDPGLPEAKLTVTGFVQSAFEPESALVDLGFLDRSTGGRQRFEVATREAATLRVLAVDGVPPWLGVSADSAVEPGHPTAVLLEVRPGAPLGRHLEVLRLRTDLGVQPEYRFRVVANVFGPVVPGSNPVDLGLVRVGERRTRSVTLTRRDGQPLVVEGVDDVPPGLLVGEGPCEEPAVGAACRLLTFTAAPEDTTPLQGRLRVRVRGESEPLPLDFAAIVAARDAHVTDLGELAPAAPPAGDATPGPVPMPSAPSNAGEQVVAGTSGLPAARIRWEATKEDMVFGYLVYRSESRAGPFVRASREIVRVPSDGKLHHTYLWLDRDVRPGVTYYYYIDTVGTGGGKQRFSPVLSKAIGPAAPTTGQGR
jgi:hypothetical protein